MILNRLLIVASGLFILILSGCSETTDPKPLTYTQLLTGTEKKTWSLTSFEVIDDGEESGPVPASQLFNNTCEADDQFVFYANAERKYEYINGPTKCSSSEPDVLLADTWSFVNATATLEFAFPLLSSGRLPYIVKSLTETSMTLEIYLDELDNVNASYRFVFTSANK
ncbi:hypothetical protein [Persicitalea jodogahamensis]|uniref:Lipocalin-like domain-containing protein n=1 Tax=Persicitalea jodogahamensis TaxID=402147 RepID=A0A8J3D689_9BACT|nr:hypothetical protein [Persicitalea jodogahamensis]GHB59106.1 hypothetical protein GCM10007390_10950 [Persicitalea jodogahamensis]